MTKNTEKSQETAVAILNVNNYPALNPESAALAQEALEANLDGDFSVRDLDRIKVPSGDSTVFRVPTLDGVKNMETLQGIIIAQVASRSYWRESMDEGGGGTPPDCASENMIIGHGNPGGECASCPLNQFGSADKGTGKGCKEIKNLLMLMEGSLLPIVVQVPPTGLKDYKTYSVRLINQGLPIYGCVTKITLAPTKNKGGVTHAKMIFTAGEVIPQENRESARKFSQQCKQALGTATQEHAPQL